MKKLEKPLFLRLYIFSTTEKLKFFVSLMILLMPLIKILRIRILKVLPDCFYEYLCEKVLFNYVTHDRLTFI